jgi:Kelch motif
MLATVAASVGVWLSVLFMSPLEMKPVTEPIGTWSVAGTLREPRDDAAAALLQDGRVLVVGGVARRTGKLFRSAEVWDPRTSVSKPAGSMIVPRAEPTATLLDDGRVLVAGGSSYGPEEDGTQNTVEIWDPATKRFSKGAPMNQARRGHIALRLADGSVAVAGGAHSGEPLEVWSASSGVWQLLPTPDCCSCDDTSIVPLGGGGFIDVSECAQTLALWRWTGKSNALELVKKVQIPRKTHSIAMTPDEVVVFSDVAVVLWKHESGGPELKPFVDLGGLARPCWPHLRLSPDRLMCFSQKQEPMRATILDLTARTALPAGTTRQEILDGPLVALPDGRALAISGRKVLLWTPATMKPPKEN